MAVMFKMATCADCNTIAGKNVFTGDLNRCPTRAEIASKGAFVISGNYADNQLVNVSDIFAKPTLSISPTTQAIPSMSGGSFNLNITSNTSWSVAYPSWCSGPTSGTGNASIRVTVASNTGDSRSGSIVVTATTAGQSVSATCAISQSGKPTIRLRAYGIDLEGKTMEIGASRVVLDDLDISVNAWNSSSLITASGRGTLRKGSRSVLIKLHGSLDDGNISGQIVTVNGTRIPPYETGNAIYQW